MNRKSRNPRKHSKKVFPIKIPPIKEKLHKQTNKFFLNLSSTDRLSYSVQRNLKNTIKTIDNISYEIKINDKWEWVDRYDDHGGSGLLHRHFRILLKNNSDIQSAINIKKYKNKDHELTWCCKEIKRNYLNWRHKLLKNQGLDLY